MRVRVRVGVRVGVGVRVRVRRRLLDKHVAGVGEEGLEPSAQLVARGRQAEVAQRAPHLVRDSVRVRVRVRVSRQAEVAQRAPHRVRLLAQQELGGRGPGRGGGAGEAPAAQQAEALGERLVRARVSRVRLG